MQIFRMNKLDFFPVICRCYGTQRTHRNYYEILEVSPNCSQKEIRKAFLMLSKKWHPDIIGNKGHDKFVKLQEAYKILGKEDTRKQYDMGLRYHTYSPHSSSYQAESHFYSRPTYRSYREWEEQMARGNWQPGKSDFKNFEEKKSKMIIAYTVSGIILVLLQLLFLQTALLKTKKNLQHEYQREYNMLKKSVQGLTLDEQINVVQERYKTSQRKKEEKDRE